MSRGHYGGHRPNAFRYPQQWFATHHLGQEVDEEDAENRAASEAARIAVADLVAERTKLYRPGRWDPDRALSKEQMQQIMNAALQVARASEKNLSAMIEKVPGKWETHLRTALLPLQSAIAEAPNFEMLVESTTYPTVVPGFRDWIRHLLSYTEDSVMAIAHVAHIIPDWLRMRDLLSTLHKAALAVIDAAVTAVNFTASIPGFLANIPTAAKVAGVVALAGGLAYLISKAGK